MQASLKSRNAGIAEGILIISVKEFLETRMENYVLACSKCESTDKMSLENCSLIARTAF